jgi:hypothetical protein
MGRGTCEWETWRWLIYRRSQSRTPASTSANCCPVSLPRNRSALTAGTVTGFCTRNHGASDHLVHGILLITRQAFEPFQHCLCLCAQALKTCPHGVKSTSAGNERLPRTRLLANAGNHCPRRKHQVQAALHGLFQISFAGSGTDIELAGQTQVTALIFPRQVDQDENDFAHRSLTRSSIA